MIHSKDEIILNLMPNSDAANIFAKYEAHNEPMPCCVFLGGDPSCFLSAAMPLAPGISETEIAGGLTQDPIEMVPAETIDMLVPGNAELVIEGELLPNVRKEEGPFAEYVRYSERTLQPVMKIKAITHREKPIIPFVMEGCKVSDSMVIISIGVSVELKRGLDTERMFKVRWVNLPVEFKLSLVVVATQVPYRGYNYFIAKYLLSKKRKSWFDKIMIVDSDIVPVDLWEVINDFAQKTDVRPGKGVIIEELEYPLTPTAGWATKAERERGAARALVFDCTWKDNWPKEEIPVRITFENSFPQEIQDKVIANWKKYGFTMEPEVKRVEEKWSRGLLMAR
jgi:4-hydroxy-3-polyprenylbenzoate decarboxylase